MHGTSIGFTMTRDNKHRVIMLICLLLAMAGCANGSFKEANELAARGEWDEAVLKYSEVNRKEPDNIEYKTKYRQARFEAAFVHFNRGEENLKGGNYETAQLEFQAAIMLEPGMDRAKSSLNKTKKLMDSIYYYGKGVEALKEGREREAKASFKKAVALNHDNLAATAELAKMQKAKKVVIDGYELDLKSADPIAIEFKEAGVKKVFEVISKLSGINFVFDEDVKDIKTSVYLKNATFQQALDLTLMTNKLSKKIVNENTIIIYPATSQKAQQYEELMIKVFYLTNTDAKKTVNLIKTMVKVKDIQVHEELNAIVIRAKPEAIDLAKKILEATDLADSEVMLVVEVMEINRNKAMNLGLDLSPDSISATIPTSSGTTGTITLKALQNLSAGQLLIGMPGAILGIKKEDLDANVLANPRIRVKNNSKAKIHIGDRIPIITTTVNQGISTENIQYQDVGLKLNVEPTVRPSDEVDLKVGLEVSTLGTKTTTNSGSVAYQIGTRNAETVLRLRDGETQIIGGLISDEERTTVAKIPLLGDIPVMGKLFSRTDTSKVKTDILLSITPYVVRKVDVPDIAVDGFMSGRDEMPSTRSMLESFSGESRVESMQESTTTDIKKETSDSTPPRLIPDRLVPPTVSPN